MKAFRKDSFFQISLLQILLVYLLFALFLLPFYQYQINPDGVSYIGIAQKYLAGNFKDAVNGYWGMFYPLLLVPFLALPITPLLAGKLLALFLGSLLITGFYSLAGIFSVSQKVKILSSVALIPPALYFAYSVTTSDLLLTTLLLFYHRPLFDPRYGKSAKPALLCGLIGGLAYLTKQYALPFFLVHFFLANIIYYKFGEINVRKAALSFLSGLLVLLIIAGLWSAALTAKYGYFTLGTSGQYNTAIVGPFYQGQHPSDINILIPPPNSSAVSAWEDPGIVKVTPWNPLGSFGDLKYQFFIFRGNLPRIVTFLEIFSLFSVWIIIQSAFSIFRFGQLNSRNKVLTLIILYSIIVYTAGYSLLVVQERYLWPVFVLVLLLGAIQLDLVQKEFRNKVWITETIIMIFILSFMANPVFNLLKNLNTGQEYFKQALELRKIGIINANIAANTNGHTTAILAFESGNRYFGQTGDYRDTKSLIELLLKNKINYYLTRDTTSVNKELDIFLPEISNNALPSIKIYRVNSYQDGN